MNVTIGMVRDIPGPFDNIQAEEIWVRLRFPFYRCSQSQKVAPASTMAGSFNGLRLIGT